MHWTVPARAAVDKALKELNVESTLDVLLSTEQGREIVRRAIRAKVPVALHRDARQIVALQAPEELARVMGIDRRELAARVNALMREGKAEEIRNAVEKIPADLRENAENYIWDIIGGD
jgi:hypothetical protein